MVISGKPSLFLVHNVHLFYKTLSFSGGGGLLSPKTYVDVPAEPQKSDYLYTNFLPNFPPISIPFSKELGTQFDQIGCILQ